MSYTLQYIVCIIFILQNERISYEEFRDWLLAHPDATTVTRWLLAEPCHVSLSNDLETPTFYQTLAGVTHCELINFMYKRFFVTPKFS